MSRLPRDQGSRMTRLRALIAPLAADRNSVIDDERSLEVARQVCEALLSEDADGGLSRSELLAHIEPDLRELADRRIPHFEALGLLATYTPKRHQQRYTLNMAGYIGLMVAERISERGGVEELLGLLARTRQEIEAGILDAETISQRLHELRRTFVGFANELRRRRHTDHLRELALFIRDHDGDRATSEVAALSRLVSTQMPQLAERAAALIRAAQSYAGELEAVARKLIDEGAAAREFALLDPADYDQAARTGSLAALAEIGAWLVFDRGTVPVTAVQIAQALATYRPRAAGRRHPPRPPASEEPDPLGRYEARRREEWARVERQADLFAQGAQSVELTDRLRATPWEGTRKLLSGLLTIHQHEPLRYRVHLADSVLVDGTAQASYFTPTTLRRASASTDNAVLFSEDGPEADGIALDGGDLTQGASTERAA
jgi:hypothetical protein